MNLSYIQQNKIGLQSPSRSQQHPHSPRKTLVKPRSAFTNRIRQQSLPPNISKTISTRITPQMQSEQKVSLSLAKFDRMQLEDFLKVVIVGQQKVSEDKSKEIICSLNGTWFKNTSSDRPASKFYNSIGIRKHKNAVTTKKLDFNPLQQTSLLLKNYPPVTGFPVRKYIPRKITRSKPMLLQQPKSNFLSEGELKGSILKKMTKPKPTKRSYSSFLSRDVEPKQSEWGEVLKGKRMIIHD